MADLNLRVGLTIQTQDGREGAIRYIGPLHIATGEWLGLELPKESGKNDGSVKGERYFKCEPGHGIFVRKESAVKIVRPLSTTTTSTPQPNGTGTGSNGIHARARPSNGVSADVAKKRQSLMSTGSGAAAGSWLSIRVN